MVTTMRYRKRVGFSRPWVTAAFSAVSTPSVWMTTLTTFSRTNSATRPPTAHPISRSDGRRISKRSTDPCQRRYHIPTSRKPMNCRPAATADARGGSVSVPWGTSPSWERSRRPTTASAIPATNAASTRPTE